jgi:hypothetical protein
LNRLQRAAWIAFGAHLIAGCAMAFVLSRGLETTPDLHERLTFLVDHRAMWTFGWLTWTAAALAILYFYISFAEAHDVSSRFAVWLTVAAIGPDLAAQSIEIGVLPMVAAHVYGTNEASLFLLLHRVAVMLSGFAANTLYSATALVLAIQARGRYPAWITVAGVFVGVFGFALSVAALMDSASGMFWTNVLLVPALLIWLAAVAACA